MRVDADEPIKTFTYGLCYLYSGSIGLNKESNTEGTVMRLIRSDATVLEQG